MYVQLWYPETRYPGKSPGQLLNTKTVLLVSKINILLSLFRQHDDHMYQEDLHTVAGLLETEGHNV